MSTVIKTHCTAAQRLMDIKDEIPSFILEQTTDGKSLTEYHLWKWIRKRFQAYGLRTDSECPIVAFGKNTSRVHYFPSKQSETLRPEMPIMIDMWAHLPNGCYADITWMFYYGKRPNLQLRKLFNAVAESRDLCLQYIKKSIKEETMPQQNRCDSTVRDHLNKKKLGAYYFHSTGHPMTVRNVHGHKSDKGLSPRNTDTLNVLQPYTIEPGLYLAHLDSPVGVRSEIDFYISETGTVEVTTHVQESITLINSSQRLLRVSRTKSDMDLKRPISKER